MLNLICGIVGNHNARLVFDPVANGKCCNCIFLLDVSHCFGFFED